MTRFRVDPASGEVRTLAAGTGLDFELQREHVLTIGTREAELAGAGAGEGATTTLTVTVLDVSDVPPTWTQLPPGNTIQVRQGNVQWRYFGFYHTFHGPSFQFVNTMPVPRRL